MTYKYTWKHTIQLTSDTTLETTRPLEAGKVLLDLYTGQKHQVVSISKAKEYDRGSTLLPEDVVQTLPAGSCNEEELAGMREKADYVLMKDSKPFSDVVF